MADYKIQSSRVLPLLMVLLGNTIYALSVKLFLLPANLISCGTTGIALVVNQLLHIPMPEFIFVFNVLMLALGWLVLGSSLQPARRV